MINLIKVMKTLLIYYQVLAFEQYKDIKTTLGLSASYDDLRQITALEIIKKTKWDF